jgi:glutamine amidotransferase
MIQPKIVIVNYGIGNTHSVHNAIKYLGYNKILISDNPKIIESADALILPGVGAFEACANNLRARNLHNILGEFVLGANKPILGICVGMQLLATFSEENGIHQGLGWIKAKVVKMNLPQSFIVPHVGWNNVKTNGNQSLFSRNDKDSNFYFDHSYHFECDEKFIVGYCDYGIKVTAAVQDKNIFGVQFHPEKSQTSGLRLFRSFFNLI